MTAYSNPPMFDCVAFAAQLREAVQAARHMREVAQQSGVDISTISRACRVYPALSHENYLRLTAWMESLKEVAWASPQESSRDGI